MIILKNNVEQVDINSRRIHLGFEDFNQDPAKVNHFRVS